MQEVKIGIPDALQPEETDPTKSSDNEGGLSGGEVAAIVVVILILAIVLVIVVAGVLVLKQRRQRKFEIATSGDEYHSIDGTYHTDTFTHSPHGGKDTSGTFPMQPGSNVYTPVPEITPIANPAIVNTEDEGPMREEHEESSGKNVTKNDHLGESSKNTHL